MADVDYGGCDRDVRNLVDNLVFFLLLSIVLVPLGFMVVQATKIFMYLGTLPL